MKKDRDPFQKVTEYNQVKNRREEEFIIKITLKHKKEKKQQFR
jgi:hypothetical protein